jgi:hypothetical protein
MNKTYSLLMLLAIVAKFAVMAGCTGNTGYGTPVPTPTANPDLTNQNSPEAATFTSYPAITNLHTPDVISEKIIPLILY